MKRTPFLFAILSCLVLGSCGSSTGPTDGDGMTCKIDGVAWSATGGVLKSGTAPEAYVVGLTERNGLTESFGLQIDSAAAGRVIPMGSDSLSTFAPHIAYSRSDGTWKTRNGSGSITISEVGSGRVKGTFSCTLYKGGTAGADSMKITEGAFNSPY